MTLTVKPPIRGLGPQLSTSWKASNELKPEQIFPSSRQKLLKLVLHWNSIKPTGVTRSWGVTRTFRIIYCWLLNVMSGYLTSTKHEKVFFEKPVQALLQTERTRYCCLTPTQSSSKYHIYHPPHLLPYPTLQAASKEFYLKSHWNLLGWKTSKEREMPASHLLESETQNMSTRPVPLVESLVNPSLELRRS